MNTKRILVIGLGSAGKRHFNNLVSLGCRCAGMDLRRDRRAEASALTGCEGVFPSIPEALEFGPFDGAVIASPPAWHIAQMNEVAAGGVRAILCEKPLTTDLAKAGDLALPEGCIVLLGYTYRWWPPLRRMRELLAEGAVGKIRHVRAVMCAHLADWHPWERYQDFFMSSKEQGGGALLDESHILDLVRWLFGEPESVFAKVEHISDLDITTDDNVDILMTAPGGLRISVHLDLYARPHERQITVVGEGGTLRWSYERNAVEIAKGAAQEWDSIRFQCERNEMFLGVAKEFLGAIDGGGASLTCTVRDGIEVMRLIEACRRSSDSGKIVATGEVGG